MEDGQIPPIDSNHLFCFEGVGTFQQWLRRWTRPIFEHSKVVDTVFDSWYQTFWKYTFSWRNGRLNELIHWWCEALWWNDTFTAFSVGVGAFVIGLSQISSFFSFYVTTAAISTKRRWPTWPLFSIKVLFFTQRSHSPFSDQLHTATISRNSSDQKESASSISILSSIYRHC